jgi:hypothetical protein
MSSARRAKDHPVVICSDAAGMYGVSGSLFAADSKGLDSESASNVAPTRSVRWASGWMGCPTGAIRRIALRAGAFHPAIKW